MAETPRDVPQPHRSKYAGVLISTIGNSTRYCTAMHVPTMTSATCDQMPEDRGKEPTEVFYIGRFKHEISAAVAADVARWGLGPDSCKGTDTAWNFHSLAMCFISTMHSSFPSELRSACAGLLTDGVIDSLLANNLSEMGIFQLDSAAVRAELVRYYGEQATDGLKASVDAICQALPADVSNAFNANIWPREAWSALLSELATLRGTGSPPRPADGAPEPLGIRVGVARHMQFAPSTDPSTRLVQSDTGVTLIDMDDKYRGVIGRRRATENEPVLPDDYYAAFRGPEGPSANCEDVARHLRGHDQAVDLSGPFAHDLSAAVEHDVFQFFRNGDIVACNFPGLAYHFVDAMRRAGVPQFPKGEAGRLMDAVISSVRQIGCIQLEKDVYRVGTWPAELWSEILLPSAAPATEPEPESPAVPDPAARRAPRPGAYEPVAYSPYEGADDEIEESPEDEAPCVREHSVEEDESDTVTFNFWWHCPNVHPADPPVKTLTVQRTFQRSPTTACACRVHSDMNHLFPFATEFAHVRNDARYRPSRRMESLLQDVSNAHRQ